VAQAGPEHTGERENGVRRQADHASIARLAEELLPALIAKLASTQLGELEVREGEWRVRLRRPYGTAPGEGRRSTDRPFRAQGAHDGLGHARTSSDPHRATRGPGSGPGSAADPSGNGSRPDDEPTRSIATSPAVGIFRAGARAAAGSRVRAGDSLGTIDVLGVPQDVTAPVDGIVGATLVETETAVEYGQRLVRIEIVTSAASRGAGEAR
jgi:biotin carboxyl carrier protein